MKLIGEIQRLGAILSSSIRNALLMVSFPTQWIEPPVSSQWAKSARTASTVSGESCAASRRKNRLSSESPASLLVLLLDREVVPHCHRQLKQTPWRWGGGNGSAVALHDSVCAEGLYGRAGGHESLPEERPEVRFLELLSQRGMAWLEGHENPVVLQALQLIPVLLRQRESVAESFPLLTSHPALPVVDEGLGKVYQDLSVFEIEVERFTCRQLRGRAHVCSPGSQL
ncbi:hypothetical protein PV692_08835 [Streptomyces sp. AK04-4c]|uniref:hypothetical protein n=1 Tax=Streptomyces sp. AK04-4c TaxID=3028651 RepID=UPI0029A048EB|nr:hypothetical protein [Streptomyces sp. AK04-4c]MDX3683692.1 hypothetical protein [Streptomyces sp. AK04-4c]